MVDLVNQFVCPVETVSDVNLRAGLSCRHAQIDY